jgi:hypothetical protein
MEKIPDSSRARRPGDRAADGSGATAARAGEPEGGESACFAHLVCEECGALDHEGHHDGCARAAATSDG